MAQNFRIGSYDDHGDSEHSNSDPSAPSSLGETLRASCLINNYNYADYLCEAVESAIEQELAFDEIIVVDDGSTDDSLRRLRRRFGTRDRLHVVAKNQGGQLSCIQRASQIATGDLIFFLDSDDRQLPELSAEVGAIYQRRPSVDFVSVGHELFGPSVRRQRRASLTRDRGISTIATVLHRQWVGAATSCLSMRSSLLRKVLGYPHTSAWQTRADDVLVYGSSILGAHKYHLEKCLVQYRMHGQNCYAGRTWSPACKMRYALEVNRMIQWYIEQMGYEMSTLARLSSKEFRTIERPRIRELTLYLRMATHYSLSWDVRIRNLVSAARHYVKETFRSRWDQGTEEMPKLVVASQHTPKHHNPIQGQPRSEQQEQATIGV